MEKRIRRTFLGRIKDCFNITRGYLKAIFFTVTDYKFFYDRNIVADEDIVKNLEEGILSFLKELSEKQEFKDAPTKTERFGKWHELVIGIGKDNTVSITLTDEDLEALKLYRRT